MTGESLHGNSEKPFSEASKAKPGLHWRAQGVGDASAMHYLTRKATERE